MEIFPRIQDAIRGNKNLMYYQLVTDKGKIVPGETEQMSIEQTIFCKTATYGFPLNYTVTTVLHVCFRPSTTHSSANIFAYILKAALIIFN